MRHSDCTRRKRGERGEGGQGGGVCERPMGHILAQFFG